jgi:4-hydroxybenzoate polyprenyltransferase
MNETDMTLEKQPDEEMTPSAWRGPADIPVALLLAMRPKQWTKNLFVFAALVFTNNIPLSFADGARWQRVGITALSFLLFCLVSGSIYLMNDIADREKDRLHPAKRLRPIASGRLPWQIAAAASIVFGWGGIAVSFLLPWKFGAVILGYYLLQIAYTYVLKHMVLIDVFAIAAGFLLRAVGGSFVIEVPISAWLLVCMFQLALFLGFGKRRHEIVSLAEDARKHRQILSQYSETFIDQLIAIVLGGLIVSYAIYSIMSPTAVLHPGLVISLPCVMYGCFRYLYLIHIEHKGGSPETILLEDRPMQINMALWVIIVIAAFKIAG